MNQSIKEEKKMLRWTDAPVGEKIVDIVVSLNEQAQKLHNQEVATASVSNSSLKTSPQLSTSFFVCEGDSAFVSFNKVSFIKR